ncbi:MAG: M48 family metallopeptidase, partial [Planctomycetota bacterium]
ALVLIAFLVVLLAEYGLEIRNLRHLRAHGQDVPPEFEGEIDPETLAKTSAYTMEHARLGFIESGFRNVLLILFLFAGWITIYDGWIGAITPSFVLAGTLFFLGLFLIRMILGIPFNLYGTFSIENRYGFNRKTPALWVGDLIKSVLLTVVFLGGLAAGAFAFMRWSPEWWWLWVWGFLLVFQFVVMFLLPYLLGILFFKFEPIQKEGLEGRIRDLVERAGFKVKGVFQIDASRRTTHSNAFFMGIGRAKRIALFDTLIEQMSEDEILAVLAHEIGHWKMRHILKRILLSMVLNLLGLFLAFQLIQWGGLPGWLGLEKGSVYVDLMILGFLKSIVTFPLTPLTSLLSRRNERQADRYAASLTGNPAAMASSLVKLARENLSNLHPHPFYAKVYYSHPPDVERVRSIRALAPHA